MASFKDANGKTWTVQLDAPTIKAVRDELKIDLVDSKGTTFSQLADDPITLVDVLWVICREQASAAGITDEQFGRALVGDPIEQATGALLDAICDFFPQAKRKLLAMMRERDKVIRDKGMELAIAKISDPALVDRAIAAMEAEMEAAIKSHLTRLSSVTNSPDGAESAPKA